jgi:predicted amidophosphoribosyltransferase
MQGVHYLNALYNRVIDYIFPKRCMAFAELTQEGGGFCSTCWKELEFVTKQFYKFCGRHFSLNIADGYGCLGCIKDPPSYDIVRVLLKFNDTSKKVIHAFKYYDKTILAKNFATMLCARYMDEISSADLIIPVPMHRFK